MQKSKEKETNRRENDMQNKTYYNRIGGAIVVDVFHVIVLIVMKPSIALVKPCVPCAATAVTKVALQLLSCRAECHTPTASMAAPRPLVLKPDIQVYEAGFVDEWSAGDFPHNGMFEPVSYVGNYRLTLGHDVISFCGWQCHYMRPLPNHDGSLWRGMKNGNVRALIIRPAPRGTLYITLQARLKHGFVWIQASMLSGRVAWRGRVVCGPKGSSRAVFCNTRCVATFERYTHIHTYTGIARYTGLTWFRLLSIPHSTPFENTGAYTLESTVADPHDDFRSSFRTPLQHCVRCQPALTPADVMAARAYTLSGVKEVEHVPMRRTSKSCRIRHLYNYRKQRGKKLNTMHHHQLDVVFLNCTTGFTKSFLEYHSALQFRGCVSINAVAWAQQDVLWKDDIEHVSWNQAYSDASLYYYMLQEAEKCGRDLQLST